MNTKERKKTTDSLKNNSKTAKSSGSTASRQASKKSAGTASRQTSKKPAATANRQASENYGNHQKKRRPSREEIRKRQIRYLLQGLFLGFCICLLLFSIWKLGSILLGYRSGEKEYEDLRQYVLEEPVSPSEVMNNSSGDDASEGEGDEEENNALVPMTRIDLTSLRGMNSDAIGWIEIPGTAISYPVVHTTDNSFYLTHTFRKENNKSGSIFIETANQADLSDLHTIIYGHNMKDGSMFAGLKNYQKEKYWSSHPYIYLDLADGSHCYEIFSCHTAEVTDISYTIGYAADETYASFLDTLKASSLYDTGVSVGTSDAVITLSTCTSNGKDRFVVHAKKLY